MEPKQKMAPPSEALKGVFHKFIHKEPRSFTHPVIPRLVLEVSKNDNICAACNSPDFTDHHSNLNVKDLSAHVKARLASPHFVGFTICSIVTCEDKVHTLDMFGHVLQERLLLYRPENYYIAELCVILSCLENCPTPTPKLLDQYLKRARFACALSQSPDAAFLLHGIEVLVATLVAWCSLQPEFLETLPSGLQAYCIYKDLLKFDPDCKDLMTCMFCSAFKLEHIEEEKIKSQFTFNLFYSPTILTKHYNHKQIVKHFKRACSEGVAVSNIILKNTK